MTTIEVLAVLGPVLIVAVALLGILLARWQDEREDRRRAAKDATAHRP